MSQNDKQQNPEKLKTKISDEAERKRRENALDKAIENTFPASDPVSAEQPVYAHSFEIPPITFASSTSRLLGTPADYYRQRRQRTCTP